MQSSKLLKNFSIIESDLLLLNNENLESNIRINNIITDSLNVTNNANINNILTNNIESNDIICNLLNTMKGNITNITNDTIVGSITSKSLNANNMTTDKDVNVKNINCDTMTILNNGNGRIVNTGNIYCNLCSFTESLNCDTLTGTSLDTDSGTIQTNGTVSGNSGIFKESLNTGSIETVVADISKNISATTVNSEGDINNSGKLSGNHGSFKGKLTTGDIICNSLNIGSGNIQTIGTVFGNEGIFTGDINTGDIICSSLDTGITGIKTSGILYGDTGNFKGNCVSTHVTSTSLNTGSGIIKTDGSIMGKSGELKGNVKTKVLNILNLNIKDTLNVEELNANIISNSSLLNNIVCNKLKINDTFPIKTDGNIICSEIETSDNILTNDLYVRSLIPEILTQDTGIQLNFTIIKNGLIIRNTLTPYSDINDTLPSAKELISGLSLSIGDSFCFQLELDNSSSSFNYNLIGNTGVTSKLDQINSYSRMLYFYKIVITSNETYDIYNTQITSLIN